MFWKALLLALAGILSLGLPLGAPVDRSPASAAIMPGPAVVPPQAIAPQLSVVAFVPPAAAVPHSALPMDAAPDQGATSGVTADLTPQAVPSPSADPAADATPRATPKPTPKPRPTPTPTPKPPRPPKPPDPKPDPNTFTGSSHFWYPALGINASWRWYGCQYGGGKNGLGPGVYRYACVDNSNIYMLGHAWSTFRKVMNGYHSGALQVGQNVWYASPDGKVTQWKVKWIRHVTDAYLESSYWKWATNASPTPIMTLQTCDGRYSQFRIIVRLVPA